MGNTSTTQTTSADPPRARVNGPVIADMAAESSPGIAGLDAQWAAVVLAGQAITYAVDPGPADALSDVLAALGLVDQPPAGWAPGATVGTRSAAVRHP
jgi:hypothetical protein